MEDKLRRLAVLVAALTLLGFGGASLYSYYRAQVAQAAWIEASDQFSNLIIRCENDPDLLSCRDSGSKELRREWMAAAANEQQHQLENAESFLMASLAIPGLILVIFFGVRWIITGKLKGLAKSQDAPIASGGSEPSRRLPKKNRWGKWLLILLAVLVSGALVLLRPQQTLGALISASIQGIAFALLAWLFYKAKK